MTAFIVLVDGVALTVMTDAHQTPHDLMLSTDPFLVGTQFYIDARYDTRDTIVIRRNRISSAVLFDPMLHRAIFENDAAAYQVRMQAASAAAADVTDAAVRMADIVNPKETQ